MSVLSFALILLTRFCACAGQIFFKKAMHRPDGETGGNRFLLLACGIAVMTLSFFLWLGLMKKIHDLSYLYPFVGLDHILLVLGAWIFLKERASLSLWIGVILISAGVALVSVS